MSGTLIGSFLETVQKYDKPAQFIRKTARGWEPISAKQSLEDVENLGLGLESLGVARGDRVAILSENRYEWPVADLAILGLGGVSVPIYPTLTGPQCAYILENSQAKAVVVSTPAQLEKVRAIAD